jgi:uncharacterized protein YndB with AHSA1/START domain
MAAENEIVITRVFDAPRELVYEAYTKPEHVVHWWGPRGFTNTIHEMDVRPGGVWRLTMHGPDGVDYPNRIDFTEVVPNERLVYLHRDDVEEGGSSFHVTTTFADEGGQTRLTMTILFDTKEARDHVVENFGAIEGGNQTMDRLGEYLAKR